MTIAEVALRRFENPDEVRVFEKGRLELVSIGSLVLARATYEPGWRWSLHVGSALGARLCVVEHVGMVVTGVATVAFEDGRVIELTEAHAVSISTGGKPIVLVAEEDTRAF